MFDNFLYYLVFNSIVYHIRHLCDICLGQIYKIIQYYIKKKKNLLPKKNIFYFIPYNYSILELKF